MEREELRVLGRIAVALERIADNQEKVIGLNQDADAFVRVVTGERPVSMSVGTPKS